VNLFFESGSTVAYVARAMSKRLAKEIKIEENNKANIHIATNNILAFLQLWLVDKVICSTFPWGPPVEDTYGTLYGGLIDLHDKYPTYFDPSIDKTARREIETLKEALYSLTKWENPVLIISTSSGLQLSEKYDISFDEKMPSNKEEEYRRKIMKCKGPHVGSYHNMVFKRFLYEIKIPVMFFLTGNKIDSKIRAGKCHFVFDSQFTWDNFYKNHPVAFCVGCEIGNNDDNNKGSIKDLKKALIDAFIELGFEIYASDCCKSNETFIAKNKMFLNEFDYKLPK
jgi:hypothetical protein